MLHKVWEVAVLVVVVCLAAQLVLATITPLIPIIITSAIVLSVIGTIYHRKKNW